MVSTNAKTILNFLHSDSDTVAGIGLYAVLDAARSKAIVPTIVKSAREYYCLYRGTQAQELATVAPYLVALGRDDAFTDWLIETGWGDSWGMFVASPGSLIDLRKHFRKFVRVYNEEGESLFFRYYDPRVLRVYLPTCNAGELKQIFGPVTRYAVENKTGDAIVTYTCTAGKLTQHATSLMPSTETKL